MQDYCIRLFCSRVRCVRQRAVHCSCMWQGIAGEDGSQAGPADPAALRATAEPALPDATHRTAEAGQRLRVARDPVVGVVPSQLASQSPGLRTHPLVPVQTTPSVDAAQSLAESFGCSAPFDHPIPAPGPRPGRPGTASGRRCWRCRGRSSWRSTRRARESACPTTWRCRLPSRSPPPSRARATTRPATSAPDARRSPRNRADRRAARRDGRAAR